jgi:hypothetical protein
MRTSGFSTCETRRRLSTPTRVWLERARHCTPRRALAWQQNSRTPNYSPGAPITHVGIYLGDGQMISAPVEAKPISVHPVFTGFWGQHFAGGGRPR